MTTIIATSVALGKRLPPFNGANIASDKRKQMQYREKRQVGWRLRCKKCPLLNERDKMEL